MLYGTININSCHCVLCIKLRASLVKSFYKVIIDEMHRTNYIQRKNNSPLSVSEKKHDFEHLQTCP
jgi:hypothetical protein